MSRLICRLFGHTTMPPQLDVWWPSWICSRCRTNLRPDKTRPLSPGVPEEQS